MGLDQITKALKSRHSKDILVFECKNGPTVGTSHRRMDAWAARRSWRNQLYSAYEFKVSRSDFLNDDKWRYYLQYCNVFYFVTEDKLLIQPNELPPEAGLLVRSGPRLMTIKQAAYRDIEIPADVLLYILISRANISACAEIDKPSLEERRLTFEQWKRNKADQRKFGRLVSREIARYVYECRRDCREATDKAQTFGELEKLLKGLGVHWNQWTSAEYLAQQASTAAARRYEAFPPDLIRSMKMVIKSMTEILETIDGVKSVYEG